MDPILPIPIAPAAPGKGQPADRLMSKAQELEATFLAEMLGHAGLDDSQEGSFTGGIGEEQFASFLREEQAKLIVAKGGIGLAESLFRAMGGTEGSDG